MTVEGCEWSGADEREDEDDLSDTDEYKVREASFIFCMKNWSVISSLLIGGKVIG